MKFAIRILILVTLLPPLTFSPAFADALDAFKGQKGSLDISGGTAHIPVMRSAAQSIMSFNPNVRITVAGGGSGVGVQQVGEGLVQIGNTGRALRDSEVEKYGLRSFPFAIDGVAIAVNPRNKVNATRSVLRGVNTRFPQTGASVLAGRSGSGQTTLLRSINRLNEEFPGCTTSGRVMINFSAGAGRYI